MGSYRQQIRSVLVAAVMALLGDGTHAAPLGWESGSFARLPLLGNGDLVAYVENLSHATGYAPLSTDREAKVELMFDAIQAAINAMIDQSPDCMHPNWCAVVAAANNARYRLGRFYDTTSKRWFLVGTGGGGQAYFVINPQPRLDLVIEAPHVYADNSKLEARTDTEGALLLQQTQGRALLINGADRCQEPESSCSGTLSSDQVCAHHAAGDKYRKSDAAHNTDSVFQVLHRKLNASRSTRFVQLHGNSDERLPPGGVSVSDSRENWMGSSGLATAFANAIQTIPNDALTQCAVNDCTKEDQDLLCGYLNVQGRYTNTNDPIVSCNNVKIATGGTRFLHLEQRSGQGSVKSLIDAPKPVIDALHVIFQCQNCPLLPVQRFISAPDCPFIIKAGPAVCPEFF